ncbi:MAG TPA: GNAT family N-acetyltransferase [Nitrososphaeraceae archaeon]|jgi:glucosamine-phosphate N-acetyltransferase|nr:GNAT family N-acetyltransferase [Nitrososphaeraceae archaeon]
MMPLKKKINFTVREIEELDLQNGFFQTLLNLTEVGEIESDYERAKKIFKEVKSWPFYRIFVAVKDDGEILGSTTLLVERKFVHNGGKVGHIEDVATKKEYEGMGIGSALVNRSVEFAKANKCYKVILDCSEKNISFYEKLGFKRHEVSMRYDFQ